MLSLASCNIPLHFQAHGEIILWFFLNICIILTLVSTQITWSVLITLPRQFDLCVFLSDCYFICVSTLISLLLLGNLLIFDCWSSLYIVANLLVMLLTESKSASTTSFCMYLLISSAHLQIWHFKFKVCFLICMGNLETS